MLVVLDELVEQSLFQQAKSWLDSSATPLSELTAAVNLNEDLIVLSMDGHKPGYSGGGPTVDLPCYGYQSSEDAPPSYPAQTPRVQNRPLLLLGVGAGETPSLKPLYFDSATAAGEPCDTEVVRLETDVFSRLKGIFDTRILSAKTVSVIGSAAAAVSGRWNWPKLGWETLSWSTSTD